MNSQTSNCQTVSFWVSYTIWKEHFKA